MAITDRTRKILWARSGNRCAMCRCELVSARDEQDMHLNLGDECHIVSSSALGPRHRPDYVGDFDDYKNLLLLCKNHHREIDEMHHKYPEAALLEMKKRHENWVAETLVGAGNENEFANRLLQRVVSGKDLLHIICGAMGLQHDEPDPESKEEMELIASFMQDLQDYMDFDYDELGHKIEAGFELSQKIKLLDDAGLMVFGERTTAKMPGTKEKWEIALVYLVRKGDTNLVPLKK